LLAFAAGCAELGGFAGGHVHLFAGRPHGPHFPGAGLANLCFRFALAVWSAAATSLKRPHSSIISVKEVTIRCSTAGSDAILTDFKF